MIRLEKEDFLKNLQAIREEDELRAKIDNFIDLFNSSYTVIEPFSCQKRLLQMTCDMMDDHDDTIGWYLYEPVNPHIIKTKTGDYYIDNDNDLYYFLAIINQKPDEDIAYYIAQKILENDWMISKVKEIANKEDLDLHAIYMYICHNVDTVIETFKNSNDVNLLTELRLLKTYIEETE